MQNINRLKILFWRKRKGRTNGRVSTIERTFNNRILMVYKLITVEFGNGL